MRAVLVLAMLLVSLSPACLSSARADPLRIFAAGSLSGPFNALLQAFGAESATIAPPVYGPSGVLRTRIEQGEKPDLFASANLAQPRRLAAEGRGGPVVLFTRNRMCLLARPALGITPDNMLDRLLDPHVRLATSTPGADPGGDYAWAVFARAEAMRPGAKAVLENKALRLVGGPGAEPLVRGHGAVAGVFLAGRADAMLGYCSSAAAARREVPELVSVPLPPALDVAPAYGMILLSDNPAAARFALFVMSERGQRLLAQFGFAPVALPPS
jgi:ABC-type molybdate transport system substrate-binding protein